ncbi:MAG: DNA polymerase III subunit delta, partial [Pseudomonadota bacterium]
MTALKGAAVERFLKRPDRTLVLLYGNDRGLVSERAEQLAKAFVGSDGEILRLDAKALQDDPGRLADEAGAISLFGGRRAIRVAAAGAPPGL